MLFMTLAMWDIFAMKEFVLTYYYYKTQAIKTS
jgi:hypothetical protein